MSDENKKTYTLVIEHIEGEDRCEFIKETIEESNHSKTLIVGDVDLLEYFSDSDVSCLTEFDIGKT